MADAAYFREYRRRRREEGRPVAHRPRRPLGAVTFTDAVMILVVAEVERIGLRPFARAAAVDHSTVLRWLTRRPGRSAARHGTARIGVQTDTLDGLVDYFGLEAIRATRAEARRILRPDPATPTATRLAPGPFLPREVRGTRPHPWSRG